MILDYIQSLPAWDALFAWFMIFGAVGLTACAFGLVLVSKSSQIKDLKEEVKLMNTELAEKEKQIEMEQHNYLILRELYHNEVRRNRQAEQEKAG